jgi:hypothetical protein
MNTRLAWIAGIALAFVFVTVSGLFVATVVIDGDLAHAIIEGRVIARSVALLLIVPAIVLLTLVDKVSGEAALAALSAIAGYLLASPAATP